MLQGTAKEKARNENAGGQGGGNSQPVAAIRFAQLLYRGEESIGEIAPQGGNQPVNFQQLAGLNASTAQRQRDVQQHVTHEEQTSEEEDEAAADLMDTEEGGSPQADVSEGFEVWTPGQGLPTADSDADVAVSGSEERSLSHNECSNDENDAGAAAGVMSAFHVFIGMQTCHRARDGGV